MRQANAVSQSRSSVSPVGSSDPSCPRTSGRTYDRSQYRAHQDRLAHARDGAGAADAATILEQFDGELNRVSRSRLSAKSDLIAAHEVSHHRRATWFDPRNDRGGQLRQRLND